jgi:hypothetical protein
MKKRVALFFLCLCGFFANAQVDSTATNASDGDLFDMSLEDLLKLEIVDRNFYLYGYINSNLQKTFAYPTTVDDGSVKRVSDPVEWTPVRNFHIYGKGNFSDKISYLFNLSGSEDHIEVRNAWGNFSIQEAFQIRVGKMYRKFGLYNERLDQIPTFIGIEAPEMLDTDHLFLTRTTSAMIHGNFTNSTREISYALMTENGEGGAQKQVIPIGWDLRYKSFTNSLIAGFSGYSSSISNEKSTSTVALGDGSPRGGILPWMKGDRFSVVGFFLEKQLGKKLLIQTEYYIASHSAVRDPEAVLTVIQNTKLNATQRDRFLISNENIPNEDLTTADVATNIQYDVQTWYIRLGYNIQSSVGQFVPYLFLDWMRHPEAIQSKTYGGDEEAGLADDGIFWKPSAGLVYRPLTNVAIKLDGSYHIQQYMGRTVSYPELRIDFSFAFSNNLFNNTFGK